MLCKIFVNEQDGIEDTRLNHQLMEQAVSPQMLASDSLGGAITTQTLDYFFLIHVTRKVHCLARTSHCKWYCHTHVPGRFDRLLLQAGQEVIDALLGTLRRHPRAEGPRTRGSAHLAERLWPRGSRPPSLRGPGVSSLLAPGPR